MQPMRIYSKTYTDDTSKKMAKLPGTIFLFSLIAILSFTTQECCASSDERGITIMDEMRKEPRIALVIGNSNYSSSPLRNPVNDARKISQILSGLGFSVIERCDASQKDMKKAIDEFGRSIRKGGVGLFYYAGHGMQIGGDNYLIPVGTKIEMEDDVEYESVRVGRVLAKMNSADTRVNIVILDACRDNPFSRSFRTVQKGLAYMHAPSGTFIAYSTAPGSVASDGQGQYGMYTEQLIKKLQGQELKIEEVFKRVRFQVKQNTGGKQIPWESSSLIGDFYFKIPEQGGVDVKVVKTDMEAIPITDRVINTPAVSPAQLPVSNAKEIDRDGNFIAYDDGTVLDIRTGLIWAAKTNEKRIKWSDAKKYCENYQGGGWTDWRLPTYDELAGLHEKNNKDKQITRLIEIKKLLWTSGTNGSKAACFCLSHDSRLWRRQSLSLCYRALPVRGGKLKINAGQVAN